VSAYEAYRRTRFFASLDGLRCLSILAVIWHHCGWQKAPGEWALAGTGYLGVHLFFVISGFLITTLLLREREDTGRIRLRDFYIRRSLRIFPLYYTVVGLYVVSVFLFERNSADAREFFANLPFFLTYTSNWFIQLEGRVIFYFAWSLAAEEQFYLVWPAIEKAFAGLAIPAIIGTVLLARAVVERAAPEAGLWATILLSIPPAILGGVLLAHALHVPRSYAIAEKVLGSRWSAPLALGGLVLAMALLAPKWIIWTLMTLVVGAAVVHERNGLPFLRWRPIAYVGTISYGMYLLHMLCHNAVKRALPSYEVLWLPATLALTIVVAGISFRYYESRFLALKKRFAAGSQSRRQPAPQAVQPVG
jgi:peptidoglycan/LPS O-acetylase OafA/YrhL